MNSQNRHYNFREINMQPLRSSVLLWFAHMFEHFCGKTHVFRPIRFMGGVFFPLISVIKIHVRKTCFFSASFFFPLLYKVRDLWRRGLHRILAGFLRIRKKISCIKPCCIKKRLVFCVCVSFIAIRSLLV